MPSFDEINLGGLDYEAAAAYALEYATSLKKYEQDLARAREELETWRKRVALATEKGMAELAAQAAAKAAELETAAAGLALERDRIAGVVLRLKEQLPMIKMGQRSVNADLLLSELTIAAGGMPGDEEAAAAGRKLESGLADMGADAALDALKKKLSEGS